MILCNLALEIEHLLDKEYLEKTIETCIHEVMEVFYRPELGGIIVENIGVDGNLVDCFEGRQVTPGHDIEAMWFIMDLGKRLNRPDLIEKAKNVTLTMINYGWDKNMVASTILWTAKVALPNNWNGTKNFGGTH